MTSLRIQRPDGGPVALRWTRSFGIYPSAGVFLILALWILPAGADDIIKRSAISTLTAVELNRGDELQFALADGRTRSMKLLDTWARVVLTDLADTKSGHYGAGSLYAFGCDVEMNGERMTMVRYAPVQQSFYEPYVVNGMRIWFDAVKRIGDHFQETHGACLPRRDARFAIQDATLPICPEELRPWYPNPDNFIDVRDCYNGDDTWLGPYFGHSLHGGLDVNHAIGTPLWAPIALDDHYYFNSLAMGHNNNRWRGVRHWDNGQRWALQTHHLAKLLVPEHTPIPRGQKYAAAAGELTGSHAHTHFCFKVGPDGAEMDLDAWILFWQIFENNKRRASAIQAHFAPLDPVRTGQPVPFDAGRSRPGPTGGPLEYCWTFGDGGCSRHVCPTHVYASSGVYPVTLTVSDGTRRDAFTQHITVSGRPVDDPVLAIVSGDEPEFARRPIPALDVYGIEPRELPRTLHFVARPRSSPRPAPKTLDIQNLGGGKLGQIDCQVEYLDLPDWLHIALRGEGNQQQLELRVSATGRKPKDGVYRAVVQVHSPGAVNSPQAFAVTMRTPPGDPATEVIVDDQNEACYLSAYYWLTPRIHSASIWSKGENGSYSVAAGVRGMNGSATYRPDLVAGKYRVALGENAAIRPTQQTPPNVSLNVTVRHRLGIETLRISPTTSREIGTFEFAEGADGFVRLETNKSEGLVVADSISFTKIADLKPDAE